MRGISVYSAPKGEVRINSRSQDWSTFIVQVKYKNAYSPLCSPHITYGNSKENLQTYGYDNDYMYFYLLAIKTIIYYYYLYHLKCVLFQWDAQFSLNIKMYILITVLNTFLMELVRRICLNIKTSYPR